MTCGGHALPDNFNNIWIPIDYESDKFCDKHVNTQSPEFDKYRSQNNHCFQVLVCEQCEIIAKIEPRENASAWKNKTNHCTEYICDKDNRPKTRDWENATAWVNKTDCCNHYFCDPVLGNVSHKWENATAWENNTNYCTHYHCDPIKGNSTLEWKNATEWKNMSNSCSQHLCDPVRGNITLEFQLEIII